MGKMNRGTAKQLNISLSTINWYKTAFGIISNCEPVNRTTKEKQAVM